MPRPHKILAKTIGDGTFKNSPLDYFSERASRREDFT